MTTISEPIIETLMHAIYSERQFSSHAIQCHQCSWKGQGDETEQEVLLLTDAIEIYCPKCASYLGFVNGEDAEDPGE